MLGLNTDNVSQKYITYHIDNHGIITCNINQLNTSFHEHNEENNKQLEWSNLITYFLDIAKEANCLEEYLRLTDNQGNTVLHKACYKGEEQIVELLLNCSTDPTTFIKM